MSAPELREAASLMCDRAETANEGSWRAQSGSAECNAGVLTLSGLPVATTYCNTDAEHIASWHPGVALAVATWLDSEVDRLAELTHAIPNVVVSDGVLREWGFGHALDVARAYLGEVSA